VILLKVSKFLSSINKKIKSLAEDSKEIKPKIITTLEKIGDLTERVSGISDKVTENIDVLGDVVEKIKDTTESVIEFEQKIQNAIEPPVMETVNTISAVTVGIKTFLDSWKNSRRNSNEYYD